MFGNRSLQVKALEILFVRCTCQEVYPAHHQCSGPIFHRDSFEIYRENRYRKDKCKARRAGVDDDTEEEEGVEKVSSLNQFVDRIREVWAALPWSAAAKGRKRKRPELSSTDEDADEDTPSISDQKLKSMSHESKHAHFVASEEPSSTSTCRHM